MEEKINAIWFAMNMKEITSEEARKRVLNLFMEQRELLIAYEMKKEYRKKMTVLRAIAEIKVDKFLK